MSSIKSKKVTRRRALLPDLSIKTTPSIVTGICIKAYAMVPAFPDESPVVYQNY